MITKGLDGNLHPYEVLDFMRLGGQVTANTTIRGILEHAFGTDRHQWSGRSIIYAEYSETRMLDEAVDSHSDYGALSLHGKGITTGPARYSAQTMSPKGVGAKTRMTASPVGAPLIYEYA